MSGNYINLRSKETTSKFLSIGFKVVVGRLPSHNELSKLKQLTIKEIEISELLRQAKLIAETKSIPQGEFVGPQKDGRLNVLVLSTFPSDNPKHGGQHRLSNLIKAYSDAATEVFSAGVLGGTSYSPSRGFVPSPNPNDLAPHIRNTFLMEDWAIGHAFEHDTSSYRALVDQIPFKPDFIHVEHPWLFGFADRYRNEFCDRDCKIIYGSANIEHELKLSILLNYFDESWATHASFLVKETEIRAIKSSDASCCVSAKEQDWIKSLTNQPCIFVPNGASKREASQNAMGDAARFTDGRKYALFCGSGHPPNITGFWDYFSNGIGCFAPDERLIVVGGVGHSISNDQRRHRIPGFDSRVRIAHEVEQSVLDALIGGAHTIVLPISYGSGTNLKTAEALLSEKYVVASTTAMRGFEKYIHSAGVFVADTPADFLQLVRTSMQQSPLELSVDDRIQRQNLSWENSMGALRDFISAATHRI
jgi:glycosyltransferase involved in cell wall biosynthesis